MAKNGRPTIRDIAEELNITASTVSRALNNHPRISDSTKKLVLGTAKKLNYQPNSLAAALRNGKSHILGIIVPTADRAFFSSVVRGVEEISNKTNYKVMICQSYDIHEKEVMAIEALLNAQVDGIIISYAKTTHKFDHLKNVLKKGIPLILFDRTTKELDVSQVVIDDYIGAYRTVEHLIHQGCSRIAHFTSAMQVSIYKERLRGYKDALDHYKIPFVEEMVIESNLQLEDGRESMRKLLKLKDKPDAVFSASDYGAMGAMQILKDKGIKIPEEIALAGFSNEPFTSFTDPPLTSVDQRSIVMGNLIAEVFFEQIADKSKTNIPQTITLKPELILRKSSLKGKIVSKNGITQKS